MNNTQKKKLIKFFKTVPYLKLVYFFGSRARKDAGPMSDYDFAVYFDGIGRSKMFDLHLEILGEINSILKSDNVDVVVLNTADSPLLKYLVISEGQILLEKQPYKIVVECQIMNEYFDHKKTLMIYHLTKAKV